MDAEEKKAKWDREYVVNKYWHKKMKIYMLNQFL